jgi:hypothetical protein
MSESAISIETHYINFKVHDEFSDTELVVTYMNPAIILPFGLIPGALVKIRDLILECDWEGNLTGHIGPTTQILLTQEFSDWVSAEDDSLKLDVSTFLDHVSNPSTRLLSVRCFVTRIFELNFKCRCSKCGTILMNNPCINGCQDYNIDLQATGSCQADDGTMAVYLHLPNMKVVSKLLKLDAARKSVLENITYKTGSWVYSDSDDPEYGGWFMNECLSNVIYRYIRVSGTFPKLPKDIFHHDYPTILAYLKLLIADNIAVRSPIRMIPASLSFSSVMRSSSVLNNCFRLIP